LYFPNSILSLWQQQLHYNKKALSLKKQSQKKEKNKVQEGSRDEYYYLWEMKIPVNIVSGGTFAVPSPFQRLCEPKSVLRSVMCVLK
jgi:hypothetical protein